MERKELRWSSFLFISLFIKYIKLTILSNMKLFPTNCKRSVLYI